MKLDKLTFFVLLLLLTSCKLGPEPTVLPTPVYSTETSNPAPTLDASASLPPSQLGMAGFRDQLAVADQFFLILANVPAPPDDQAYQGWLLGDDGTTLNTGILPLAPDGSVTLTWNSPISENLLNRYARFQITLEPAAGADKNHPSANPTGKVVFAGSLEGAALANARRLFVKNDGEPATPLDTAFALGLLAETGLAAQHVTNAVNAAAIGAQDEMRAHLEHVVNILEGASGPRYGDHDGNGTAENPGDGFGVIGYSRQIAALLPGQATVAETDASIQAQIAVIQDKCLEILQLEDPGAAASQLSELQQLIDQFQTDPVASLYQAAQDSVRFEVIPIE